MNRNDIADIFEALGGKSGFIRWSKKSAKNLTQAYSMLGRSVLQDGVADHVDDDPAIAEAKFRSLVTQTLDGIARNRERGVDALGHPIPGVSDAGAAHVANRLGVPEHGNSNTAAHSIEETPARVPQLGSSAKPRPDVAQHVAAVVRKPAQPSSNIVGLYNPNGDGVNFADDDPYGRNFSQNSASRYAPRGW